MRIDLKGGFLEEVKTGLTLEKTGLTLHGPSSLFFRPQGIEEDHLVILT